MSYNKHKPTNIENNKK